MKPVPAKLLSVSNEQLDLAVLEAELPKGAVGFGTLPLAWKSDTSLKRGLQLWTVDGKWEKVPGSVVNVTQDKDGQRVRYTSNASRGYSGGPVFDASGDLVAIHLRERSDVSQQLCDGDTFDAVIIWLASIGYSTDSINLVVASTAASAGNYAKSADVSKLRAVSAGDRGTLLFRADRFKEARPLLAEAANAGDGHAAMILSGMFLTGTGVPLDYTEGNHWASLGAAGEMMSQ